MVNVQPKNQKLVDRGARIVAQAANIEYSYAAELLKQTGSVKTSIVMAKLKLSREEAEERLKSANGRVRIALES
jgi:N-acetylmuramic acid 6-phosphate etherase